MGCGGTPTLAQEEVTAQLIAAGVEQKDKLSVAFDASIKAIGDRALQSDWNITNIFIPDNLMSIGYAGIDIINLEAINVSPGNKWLKCIDGVLFDKDMTTLIKSPARKRSDEVECGYTIPDGVTSISDFAFAWCTDCNRIIIPESVVSIGDFAFAYCGNERNIYIPSSVTSIGSMAFFASTSTEITLSPDNNSFKFVDGVLFDKSITTLIWYTIRDVSKTHYAIPDGVTKIADGAFDRAENLMGIDMPDSLIDIGYRAFFYCRSIADVIIGENVKSIGDEAFYGCFALTNVIIGESVTSIGHMAFFLYDEESPCLTLYSTGDAYARIFALENEIRWQDISQWLPVDKTITFHTASIDGVLTRDEVIAQLAAVGAGPGSTFSALFDDSVQVIGDYAFLHCVGLVSVVIPERVTDFKFGAFSGCMSLSDFTFGRNVTSIGEEAFYKCIALSRLVIPVNAKNIADYAFYYCIQLSEIYFDGNAPEADWAAFFIIADGATAYIYNDRAGFPPEGDVWYGLVVKYREEDRVRIDASSKSGGTVSGGGLYCVGESVKLIATPISNNTFDGWYENDMKISGETTYSFTAAVNRTFEARFTASSGSGDNSSLSGNVTVTAPEAEVPLDTPPLALSWGNPYFDVSTSDWFYAAVKYVTENELMNGMSSSKFSPGVTMSRAMLVTVLYRLDGRQKISGSISFLDVKPDEWYTDAIMWASQKGIVQGYDSDTFGLEDPVTREQAVTILSRYAESSGIVVNNETDLSVYSDMKDISDWALSSMKWAVAIGIIQGRTTTTIVPLGISTRAEVATIFMRYISAISTAPAT